MRVYRITKSQYARDVSGTGAYLNGGRWNFPGIYVLYTAENVALAILETLAHIRKEIIPQDFMLVTLEIPQNAIVYLEDYITLPKQWNELPPYNTFTMSICAESVFQENLVLRVPSAITQKDFNYLINPLHPDIQSVKVITHEVFEFDKRLLY